MRVGPLRVHVGQGEAGLACEPFGLFPQPAGAEPAGETVDGPGTHR